MTAKTANPISSADTRRHVVFVVYPDIVLLDLVGPLQVFSHAQDADTGQPAYVCSVVSMDGAMTQTNTVVAIPTARADVVSDQTIHTLVVVGGDGAIAGMQDTHLVANIAELSKRAERVCSVCSGALILAAAGLLDGRRAVTHWEDCQMLAEKFPKVQVEVDPIYIKDGTVWTSAGITAGIDMALAIVAEDLGRAAALAMARSMVVQMARSGGQSQFSPVLDQQLQDRQGRFDALRTWIGGNLDQHLSVEVLAKRAGMSPRNFARVFVQTMGMTPAKAVQAMRVDRAQRLLESTDKSMKQIASECGFHHEDQMRRAFLSKLRVLPSEYRQTFNE